MRQPRLILALVLPVLGAVQGAHAQKLSPGLWDMTMTVNSPSPVEGGLLQLILNLIVEPLRSMFSRLQLRSC